MLTDDHFTWFTEEMIVDTLKIFYRRCETAKHIGISKKDAVEGTKIPAGWVYEPMTCYFLPPNVVLL